MTIQDLVARQSTGSFADLRRPDDLPEFRNLISFLRHLKETGEKIVIYGDYDVDGITATAILKSAFDSFGITTGFFIPSRYREGYGLSASRIDDFYQRGYKHILTVDNGISAFAPIERAYELGMDVTIIDHHDSVGSSPRHEALFHPKISGFLPYDCSAASLSYFVASSLLGRDDEYLSLLAGLAVFSDVMPLVGNNLVFAKLCHEFLNEHKFPRFDLLLNNRRPVTYQDISFILIPVLNSPGRLLDDVRATNDVCKFLLTQDRDVMVSRAKNLLSINEQRKEMVKNISIDEDKTYETEHGLAALVDGPSGLSGLIANRLMNQYKKPVLILMPDKRDEEKLIGSIRSFGSYDAYEFISENSSLFESCGGHRYACGLSIRRSSLLKVVMMYLSAMEKDGLENKRVESEETIDIELDDICPDNYSVLERFMPFGQALPEPIFRLTLSTDQLKVSKNHRAVMAYVRDTRDHLICFCDADEILSHDHTFITFRGTMTCDVYQGRRTIVLKCDEYSLD